MIRWVITKYVCEFIPPIINRPDEQELAVWAYCVGYSCNWFINCVHWYQESVTPSQRRTIDVRLLVEVLD